MNINHSLKEIYKLYSSWDYKQAEILNNQILEKYPENIYASRYQQLIQKKLLSDSIEWKKWPIPKIKSKTLKCPHCTSKIPFSWLTQENRRRIENKDLDNLEIKCPYCHTKFTLQNNKSRSYLWIKIWDKITYKHKWYKTVWYVKYEGNWYEWNYSGKTVYLEWILLWNDNSYLYFSEWYSLDEWRKSYEFEFSKKTIPKKILWVNFEKKQFDAYGTNIDFTEYNKLKVISVYGENSKSYSIWEEIQLAPIDINSQSLVYEKETSWNQQEIWIYETQWVQLSVAERIFNTKSNIKKSANLDVPNMSKYVPFLFILFPLFIIWISEPIILLGIIFIIVSLYILFWSHSQKTYIIYCFWFLGPILLFLFIPMFSNIIENKESIEIWNVELWNKYELDFWELEAFPKKTIKTQSYSYWWKRTYYSQNIWLKFSVKTQEDKDIIQKINSWNSWYQTPQNIIINDMFEWNLYKLK